MAIPTRSSKHSKARRRRVRSRQVASPSPIVVDPRLIEGVALYNHHRFFECHDVLEQLWLRTRGRERDFYKGLIQAAVAFHHWSKKNPAGAMSLYKSSSRHLTPYQPEFLGVDVEGFLERYTALFGWLRRHRLRYDARLVPPLQFRSGK